MKIKSLLESTVASDPSNSTNSAPVMGRSDKFLEEKEEETVEESTTSGSVASVASPVGGMQRRGKGSMFAGIKTSAKYPNSKAVKEGKNSELDSLYDQYDELDYDGNSESDKEKMRHIQQKIKDLKAKEKKVNESQINEVDPRNFDSDVDYYAARNAPAKARSHSRPSPGVNQDDEAYFREIFRKKRLAAQQQERSADHDRLATGTNESEMEEGSDLKSWQVVIFNNYYAGKYSDYRGRYYYVLATSPEEAKQVVIDNADGILKDILSMKSHNGKRILPPGKAVAITPGRIGKVEDGTVAGRMSTAGYKKMFSPQGLVMAKLSGGSVVDIQEQGVAEGYSDMMAKERRKRLADAEKKKQERLAAEKAKKDKKQQGVAEALTYPQKHSSWSVLSPKKNEFNTRYKLDQEPEARAHAERIGGKLVKVDQRGHAIRTGSKGIKEGMAEGSDELYQKAIQKYARQVANDYLGGGNDYLYGANKFDSEIFGVDPKQAQQDFKTLFVQLTKQQGVAEGLNDTIYPNAEVIKSKNGKPVGEIYQDAHGWGCFHYKADNGADSIESREEALEWLKDIAEEYRQDRSLREQGVAEEKQRLDPKCWSGYKKQGTKMKGDTRVNNCVPVKEGQGDLGKALGQMGGSWSGWYKDESSDPDMETYWYDDGEGGYDASGTIEHDLRTGKVTVDYNGDEYHGGDVKGTFKNIGDALTALRGMKLSKSTKAPNYDRLSYRASPGPDDMRKTDRTGRKGTVGGGHANRLKQSIQANQGKLGPKGVLPEGEIAEDKLASDLYKDFQIFKKGADKEIGSKAKDKEISGKAKDKDIVAKEGFGDSIKKKAKQFSRYMTEPQSPHNDQVRSRAKNIDKIRKQEEKKSVFEKDPEAMREFERSGGYKAGIDVMGWQVGWAAASHARPSDTLKDAFQQLYYGGGSSFPFSQKAFKLGWVAYKKHYGPQGNLEEMDGDSAGRDGNTDAGNKEFTAKQMTSQQAQDKALATLKQVLSKPENMNVLKRLKNK